MKLNTLFAAGLLALIGHTAAPAQSLQFDRRDGDLTIVRIDRPTRYLLIPIWLTEQIWTYASPSIPLTILYPSLFPKA